MYHVNTLKNEEEKYYKGNHVFVFLLIYKTSEYKLASKPCCFFMTTSLIMRTGTTHKTYSF